MKNKKYTQLWLIFLNIKPEDGQSFNDLIDIGISDITKQFVGVWANVIVKADSINEAITITPLALKELGFEVEFIDKIENTNSLYENKEIKKQVIEEADWFLNSKYVFKISDKLFPYE